MTYYDFGKVLKRLRKEKGMTQQKLADMLSCSVPTISNIENGLSVSSYSTIELAMQLLGEDSQDQFKFILDGDEKVGYAHIVELRHLANEKDYEALRVLVKKLTGTKPFEKKFFKQFLLYCKVISSETMTVREKLNELLKVIKISKKDFNPYEIKDYLLAYNEITIIGQIASYYFFLGEKEIAIQILYGMKSSMDDNYASDWEKSRTYPSIMYNLSKYLGHAERYDEAEEACLIAKQWALKYNNMKALPGMLINMAHISYLKGDMRRFSDYYLQAYFTAQGMEQHRNVQLIIEGAKKEYNIDIEPLLDFTFNK